MQTKVKSCSVGTASVLLSLAIFVGALAAQPTDAYAYYNEIADSYPAAQDLGSYGEALSGSEIPDGAYVVGARTTSRMCLMYTNYDDAAARSTSNRELAVIQVQDGTITVAFYLSSAYTRLYFGTQEEAAALSDGEDDFAYLAGDPVEGYEPHLFAFTIPALNSPMTIATYSGGDQGWEKGRWYTRQVVFTASDSVYDAIANASVGPNPSDPEPQDPSDQGASDTGGSQPGGAVSGGGSVPGGSESGDGAVGADNGSDEGNSSPSGDDSQSDDQTGARDGAAQDAKAGSGESEEEATPEGQGEESPGSSVVEDTPRSNGKVGVLMNIVAPDEEPEVPEVGATAAAEEANDVQRGLTLFQVVLISLAAMLALGSVWRSVAFKHGLA